MSHESFSVHVEDDGAANIALDIDIDGNAVRELAIEAASVALEGATDAAGQMYRSVADAQNAIDAAAYPGTGLDEMATP